MKDQTMYPPQKLAALLEKGLCVPKDLLPEAQGHNLSLLYPLTQNQDHFSNVALLHKDLL